MTGVSQASPTDHVALTAAIRSRLDDLRGPTEAGAALVARLVDSFLARAPAYLADLATAVRRRDVDTVARLAHGLGGVAGNVGAAYLAELSERLETAPADEFDDLLAHLAAGYERVRRAFDEIIQSRSGGNPAGSS
jgi:HPt (histidine-containing phosphotransfer) domain-containing protein